MGVSIRATTKEAKTASAAVQPNCLKNLPGTPPAKAVGKNTAISVNVGNHGQPDSSAASASLHRRLAHVQVAVDVFHPTMASSTNHTYHQ